MSEKVSRYREGEYLVIKDVAEAERHISISEDIEPGMVVQVMHNFGTFLVGESADISERAGAKAFPPTAAGNANRLK